MPLSSVVLVQKIHDSNKKKENSAYKFQGDKFSQIKKLQDTPVMLYNVLSRIGVKSKNNTINDLPSVSVK